MVVYRKGKNALEAQACASGTLYSRNMMHIVKGSAAIRTFVSPRTAQYVDSRAFEDTERLKFVILEEGMGEIRSYAFSGSGVEKVRLPSTVENLCFGSLSESKKLRTVWADNPREIEIRSWVGSDALILPATPVMLGDMHLSTLRAQRDVVIPDGTKKIGSYWFAGSDIESVTIPASVVKLGVEAFNECRKLRRVDIAPGSRLDVIKDRCFRRSGLESITFPRELTVLYSDAFQECENFTTIYLEEKCSVRDFCRCVPSHAKLIHPPTKMLGNVPVSDLQRLKDVVIPEGPTEIGEYLFCHSDIESVHIPASVKVIDSGAFCGCRKLRRVTFAEGSKLERINYSAFRDSAIESIAIPPGVKVLEGGAFECCASLKTVRFVEDSRLEEFEQACFSESGITDIRFPSRLRKVGSYVFYKCKQLRSVRVNEGLESLSPQAIFEESGVELVELPSSLRILGISNFSCCKNLKRLRLPEGLEKI